MKNKVFVLGLIVLIASVVIYILLNKKIKESFDISHLDTVIPNQLLYWDERKKGISKEYDGEKFYKLDTKGNLNLTSREDKYKKYIESIQEFTEDWREKIKYNQPEVLIDWTTGIPKNRINKIKYRPYKKDENYKIRINTSEQYLFNIIEKQRKDKIIIKLIDLKENDKFLEKTLEGKKQWIVKTKEDLYPPYMKLKEDEQQSLQSSIDTYIQTKGAVNISDEDIYFGIRFEYKHLIGSKYGVYLKLKNFRGYGIAKPV